MQAQSPSQQLPLIKKEFVTLWTPERINIPRPEYMTYDQLKFFQELGYQSVNTHKVMVPNNIRFEDLHVFSNYRTKVTVEIVPF